jgi:flagellar export protein FliJ
MSTFRFRLTTLLRIRDAVRDERRGQLAAAQRAEEIIAARIGEIDEELAALSQQSQQACGPGSINIDRLLDAGRYQTVLSTEKQAAIKQREEVAAEVDRRRQALVEADREVKTLEKLREKQSSQHRLVEHRREVKQLDAAAIQLAVSGEGDQ